ncbi:MAG: DUF4365 domain-containing protein [Flavobacterium sp.]|nr:DUF4365 domain-containing protein [Flavobacterium sp.]
MPLSNNDIESELSYAYLHAISAKAGISCKIGDRHDDGTGVDAQVNYRGNTSHAYLKHVQINVQLKATIKDSGNYPNHLTYFLNGKSRFEKLRTKDSDLYKILVVLFLPRNHADWLECSKEELILKNAAYWVCLYGADESFNPSGETIYIPKSHLLTPSELLRITDLAVNKNIPEYVKPNL